jgi:hypothetical protein
MRWRGCELSAIGYRQFSPSAIGYNPEWLTADS